MDRNVATAAACLLGTFTAAPAGAEERIDPLAYPELAPEALLPAILTELRHTLPDIYSIREMRLCPAGFIKLKAGKPVSWSFQLEFNTRNEAGGFTGIRRYAAIFRNGRVAYPIATSDFVGREGLNGVFNRLVDQQMMRCCAQRRHRTGALERYAMSVQGSEPCSTPVINPATRAPGIFIIVIVVD